jgi:hypothetical protein
VGALGRSARRNRLLFFLSVVVMACEVCLLGCSPVRKN